MKQRYGFRPVLMEIFVELEHHQRLRKASMLRAGLARVVAFLSSYFFRLGFLDGEVGLAVCTMQAQAAFGKYFTVYCLNRKNDISPTPPSV